MELKKKFFTALVWTVGIAVACLVNSSSIPSIVIPGKDKMVHAVFYFVFTILWFRFLNKRFERWQFGFKATIILLFTLCYGTLMEVLQECFTATRRADFLDVLANVSGSLIGVLMLWIMKCFTAPSNTE